jgi:NhaP-type Na+/H+ or K+/H+ antiporter
LVSSYFSIYALFLLFLLLIYVLSSLNFKSVSMTLILGLYGTTNVWLGPNSSFLIKPTSVFVQNVIVCSLLSCI